MEKIRSVDDYLRRHPNWADVLVKLRNVLVTTELVETIKWGTPHYTIDGKNVVGLAAFKEYVAIWFHHGVFLTDPDGVLINAQEGTTRGLRQWRISSAREIKVRKVKAYVAEAIVNHRAGKLVKPRAAATTVGELPPELEAALAKHAKSRRAFAALTPGRQREYASYVAEAKQARTKASRVAKVLPMIEAGVGLNDRYR